MVKRATNALAGVFGIYAIVVISGLPNVFGIFVNGAPHRAISLVVALVLVFLVAAAPGSEQRWSAWWVTIPLLSIGLVGAGFVALFYEEKVIPYSIRGYLDTPGVLLAAALGLSLLVALKRMIGWALPIIIVLLMATAYWQRFLPGLLGGPGYSIDQIASAIYVGTNGVFGTPLAVAATIIVVFLIFGALLQKSGAGQWLIDIAIALTGSSRGGPAKASVVSSAMFGSISGSPSGNVATTGTFTIPLMKRTGYSPAFAGGVEAAASTGGMVLPPIMGAVAFIMAEFLEIPYAAVLKAALIPAILYFLVLLASVHFRAVRMGLLGLPRSELPPVWATFRSGWRYLLPIAALVYFTVALHLDPDVAGLYSLPVLVVVSFLTRDRSLWLTPANIWSALVDAIYAWRIIAIVTASVGMLLGTITLSGLGIKISSFVIDVSGEQLLVALAMVGLASLVLGMGLDITPLYLTLVVLTAPALIELGLSPTQAHLYVIFWGLASFITPPVCNAVYVACSISGSSLWRTGGEAMRVGAGAFVVPIAFALNPALLINGSGGEVAIAVGTALVATVLIAAALQGYGLWRMSAPQSVLVGLAGGLLLMPGIWEAIVAAALVAIAAVWWRLGIGGPSAPASADLRTSEASLDA